jgi:phage terminase Nu1 subunit (DNA packaging protein)
MRYRSTHSHKSIRWTLEKAAVEFGIDRKTLAKKITTKGVMAGEDGKFSTREISTAIFSDGEAARASLAISQRENFDLRNKKLAGELVDAKQCQLLWDSVIIALRQKIADAQIPDAAKQELVRDLQNITIDDYMANHSTSADEDDSSEPVTA